MEGLSEEERRALRGSKFAPLPPFSSSTTTSSSSRSQQPRLAHPGGPMKTNKAAALAKFLERKLQEPNGLSSINPDLIELAVNNAKRTVFLSSSGGNSNSGTVIRHVTSFADTEDTLEDDKEECSQKLGKKKKKKKNRGKSNKIRKMVEDGENAKVKRPKKKLKL